jgi:uncharacterized protein (DUF1499 family)
MWVIFVIVVVAYVTLRLVIGAASPRPVNLGPQGARLLECSPSPNCVSSQAERADQRVEPLKFTGTVKDAKLRLRQAVESMSGARVLRDEGNYLYAEYRTRVFGFIDDVEFLVDESASVIHVRSASRLGYSDLGTNRRRVEALRQAFAAGK